MGRGILGLGYLVVLFVFSGGILPAAEITDPDQYEKRCAANFEDEPLLTLADVRRFLDENSIRSTREFVAKMEKHPDFDPFLNQYVLVHTSRSAQRKSVDRDHPRLIFFHRGVIFGVTDHSTKSNARLEVIIYSKESHEWRFHLIDFSRQTDFLIENPSGCKDCHGKKPLPIWATYRTWPGAHSDRGPFFTVPNPELEKLTEAERNELKNKLFSLRYSERGSPEKRREAERIEKIFAPIPRKLEGVYATIRREGRREDGAALNGFLNRLNYHRIAHELETSQNFEKYRYAFLGALFHCDDLQGFVGDAGSLSRENHDKTWNGTTFADLLKETDSKMRSAFQRRLEIAKELGDEEAQRELQFADEDDIQPIAFLRYLFESRGVDVKRFSYNFNPKENEGYGFSEVGAGTGGLRYSFCSFLPQAVRADKELAPLMGLAPTGMVSRSDEKTYCGLLKEKSLRALQYPGYAD